MESIRLHYSEDGNPREYALIDEEYGIWSPYVFITVKMATLVNMASHGSCCRLSHRKFLFGGKLG